MTVIHFSLSVLSIIMAQTRLECFGAFIGYRSTVSNVNIIFGCVQFVCRKTLVYTCINIYGRARYSQYDKIIHNAGCESLSQFINLPVLVAVTAFLFTRIIVINLYSTNFLWTGWTHPIHWLNIFLSPKSNYNCLQGMLP